MKDRGSLAAEALASIALTDKDEDVREYSITVIKKMTSFHERAFFRFKSALKTTGKYIHKVWALDALGELGKVYFPAVKFIASLIEPPNRLRADAFYQLLKISKRHLSKHPEYLDPFKARIVSAISDPASRLRMRVVFIISERGESWISEKEKLLDVINNEKDIDIVSAAIDGLKRMNAISELKTLTNHKNEKIRELAEHVLKE